VHRTDEPQRAQRQHTPKKSGHDLASSRTQPNRSADRPRRQEDNKNTQTCANTHCVFCVSACTSRVRRFRLGSYAQKFNRAVPQQPTPHKRQLARITTQQWRKSFGNTCQCQPATDERKPLVAKTKISSAAKDARARQMLAANHRALFDAHDRRVQKSPPHAEYIQEPKGPQSNNNSSCASALSETPPSQQRER
jgi:hypothetical protein